MTDSASSEISVPEGDQAQVSGQSAPEAQAVAYDYSGVWKRFLAIFLDGILITIVGTLVASVTGNSPEGKVGFTFEGGEAVIFFFVVIAYFAVAEKVYGRTVGKAAPGLKVVDERGEQIDWGMSIGRNLLRLVDLIPYVIPYLLGATMIWTSDRNQQLGDRVVGSLVIERRKEATFKPES